MIMIMVISEINGDFSRKSLISPAPVYFAPPLKGFPWNWVLTLDTMLQCTNVTDGQTDRRTDGRTPDDSKDCAYAVTKRFITTNRSRVSIGAARMSRYATPYFRSCMVDLAVKNFLSPSLMIMQILVALCRHM